MEIHTNQELVQAVNGAIAESGYKKFYIAEQMGISRQAFTNFMNKAIVNELYLCVLHPNPY